MNQNNIVLGQQMPIMFNPISQESPIIDYYKYFNNQELNNTEIDENTYEFNNKLGNVLDDLNTKIKKKKSKNKCDINLNSIYTKINELSIKLNNFNTYIINTMDNM